MFTETQREGVYWFINRYLLSKFARQFLLRREGFDPITSQKAFNRQTTRFPELKFNFVAAGDQILIQPTNQDSEWAEGVLYIGDDGQWHYLSGEFELKVDIARPKP